MRILGHRPLRGPNRHGRGPYDYLVFRPREGAVAATIDHLAAAGLEVAGETLGDVVGATACALQARYLSHATHRSWQDTDGDWVVLTDAADATLADAAATAAVALVHQAMNATPDLEAALAALEEALQSDGPPGTRAVLAAARQRNIPAVPRGHGLWQLGWGVHQQRLWGGLPGERSGLGFEIANDHERSKQVLDDTGIPTPRSETCSRLQTTLEAVEDLGYPVTIKPLRGRGGVTVGIRDVKGAEAAYDKAKEFHDWVLIEDHVAGEAIRLLVLNGEAISALNEAGDDILDELHSEVRHACERAVRICQCRYAEVHMVNSNHRAPLSESHAKVVSLDPQPRLGDHLARGIQHHILNSLMPDTDGRIPLVAVTGTNGKTTTVRLISHMLKYAGGRVGMACTGAVEVENQVILKGDYSGPKAAQTVLKEPGVTHAVCEVARGGLLRTGLGFDRADVAVFLNVGSDHLGQGGIDTLDDLADLKGIILQSIEGGTAVLNADDERVWARRTKVDGDIMPITMHNHPDVMVHLDAGGAGVICDDNAIIVCKGALRMRVADVMEIPITLDGAAWFNIQNAMAAVAAGYALGLGIDTIRTALITFNPSVAQLPGRMNLMTLGGVKVLLDYGHNVPALEALSKVLPRLAPGRKINVANASGNRRDEDLAAFGAQIGTMYDRIILCDPDPRRRARGATAHVIRNGLLDAGFDKASFTLELDEARALRMALAESRPGDLVVLQADDVDGAIGLLQSLRARLEAGENPAELNAELLRISRE
jgi:UDP-N-acetylmuramyl tripeptide synthase